MHGMPRCNEVSVASLIKGVLVSVLLLLTVMGDADVEAARDLDSRQGWNCRPSHGPLGHQSGQSRSLTPVQCASRGFIMGVTVVILMMLMF